MAFEKVDRGSVPQGFSSIHETAQNILDVLEKILDILEGKHTQTSNV